MVISLNTTNTLVDVHYTLRKVLKAPLYMSSAVTTVARVLNIPLHELPADLDLIEELCAKIEPLACGIDPKIWSNKRAALKSALLYSGLVTTEEVRVNKYTYLPEDLAELERLAVTKRERTAISGCVRFFAREGIKRADLCDEKIEFYTQYLASKSRCKDKHKVVRTTINVLNELGARHPHLQLAKLTPLPRRTKARLIRFSDLPLALSREWERLTTWAAVIDVTSDDVRKDPVGLRTLALWEQYLRSMVTALISTGIPLNQITTLKELLTVENFDRAMSYQVYSVSGGAPSHGNYYSAKVFVGIARDFLKLDDAHIVKMERIANAVPRPSFEMTEKNKHLTLKFDDPANRNRFLTAPDRIWEEMQKKSRPNARRTSIAQASLAIQILTYCPFRLENLTGLQYDRHIILRPGGTSTFFIPAVEAKGGKTLEFAIPEPLVDRLLEYRDTVAPSVTGCAPTYLFHNVDNSNKGFATVRYLVQTYFKRYVGFHMNPHAYRHLAAKFILDADPGAHVVVKDLLGHKSLSTTINYYTGTDTKRAGRYHSNLIEQHVAAAQTDGKGRTRKGVDNGQTRQLRA